MRIAIPYWHGRVSPVFDVARHILIASVENGRELMRLRKPMGQQDLLARTRLISKSGVEVLMCGAISWPLEVALAASGVHVIAHICGQVDDVIWAFLHGQLDDRAFLMPGCSGRYRHSRSKGLMPPSRFRGVR